MGHLRRIGQFAEYALVRLLGGLINLLPFPAAFSLARGAGPLLYHFLPNHRQKALENLREAFRGEKTETEIRQIAKESFIYLAEFTVEWLRMSHLARTKERYFAIEGVEAVHSAIRDGRQGAMLLVSHGGNWEVAALIAGWLIGGTIGTEVHALARPLKNPYLYDYVLRMRGLTGLKSISKCGAVRETFRCLKKNQIVCSLVDQRVQEGSVEVNFFGRPALTTHLPILAALRLGTPLFFLFMERLPGPRYLMKLEGPFPVESAGDLEKNIMVNTQRINDRFEAEIRKRPGRWLWMHNRWRTVHGVKD